MQIHVPLCAALALGACFVSGHEAAAEGPSFDCGKARFPDEIPSSSPHAEEPMRIKLESNFCG
jgi:hypothetical protein